VTRHTDHNIFTGTSELVVWRCDETSRREAKQLICNKAPLFGGGETTKNSRQKKGNSLRIFCRRAGATNAPFSKLGVSSEKIK